MARPLFLIPALLLVASVLAPALAAPAADKDDDATAARRRHKNRDRYPDDDPYPDPPVRAPRPRKPAGRSLSTLTIVPQEITLTGYGSEQLVVSGGFSDGDRHDLTGAVKYFSASPRVATVSPDGLVQATGNGTAVIRAIVGPVSTTVTVRVVDCIGGKREPAAAAALVFDH